MAQSKPKYDNIEDISELIIRSIYKDSERCVDLDFVESGSAKTIAQAELTFRDAEDNQYDFDFETDQSAAIGGHFCALVEDEDNTEYKCYRLYYSKDQYVLIKTSCPYSQEIIIKSRVYYLYGPISKPFRYTKPFDSRSEMFCELVSSSCQEELTPSGEASSTLTNSPNEDLEFLEKKLKEMRLQKLEELAAAIDVKLNQINLLQQEAEELRATRKKVILDLYPVVYRIMFKFSNMDNYCHYQGYFSSRKRAQDMILRALTEDGWNYSIVPVITDEIEEDIDDILDEVPKNEEWVSYD